MGYALYQTEHGSELVVVGRVRPEQRIAEALAEFGAKLFQGRRIGVQAVDVPHQRVAVGVEPVGGQTYQGIACRYLRGIHHLGTLDGSEDEAGHIEIALREDAGHFGGLAADERAADLGAGPGHTLDQRGNDIGSQDAHVDVVKEQDGLRAAHYHVIDAGAHEVFSDALEPAGHHGQLELGADRIGAGDEHGVFVSDEGVHRAERADSSQHFGAVCRSDDVPDTSLDVLGGLQVDSSLFVS